MKVLADYQTKLDQVLQDLDEELEATSKAAYLQEAINTYSQSKPSILAVSIAGNATFLYDLPIDWEDGFSEIKSIEFPAGVQTPTTLDSTRYIIYQGPTGKKIRFLQDIPTASQTFILTYTKRHIVTTGTATISESDFDAVCNLAGALCCYALGRKFTEQSGGASMAVRDQTWRSVLRYSEKGKELMDLYLAQIGLISVTAINSSAVADTDAENTRKDAELVLKQNADLRAQTQEARNAIIGTSLSIPFMHMLTMTQIVAGTDDFTYPVPDDWQEFYSFIREIKYPMEDQTPAIIDPDNYFVYLGDDGLSYLRFTTIIPVTGKTFQITYVLNNQALRVFH